MAALRHPSTQYHQMGAQPMHIQGPQGPVCGVRFVVYAPNASAVSVVGDFNNWDSHINPMSALAGGYWACFVEGLETGARYKFEIRDISGQSLPHKADPWGYHAEQYPSFASLVYDHNTYSWGDATWQQRPVTAKHEQPLSIYELHPGSWRCHENGDHLTYLELADVLIPYLVDMGYTHVELMPVSEHPFYGSWGYQPVGLFAPTSRYGTPDDLKSLIDQCHQAGIGVILDWVPAHFPADDHGLAMFDGTALFHDPDPRRGWHPDWQSYIYDYGREHVRRFLVANALYWFEHFHIDGLRVDAVASMLYLDYSRQPGDWIPNAEGGNINHDAVSLLKWMNEEVYSRYPNAMTIAEESTTFPGVSRPTYAGGLGFGFKWNMGWMHDSLSYIRQDPVHRRHHHGTLTFPLVYAFSENYVLSLSHDEVVYGKGSLLNKMPGDEWQQTANLRAFLGYMYGQPGKKLNFMGTEIAQSAEWDHDGTLAWHHLQYARHQGVQRLVKDLNHLYRETPALYELDCDPSGFAWRVSDDAEQSVIAHERRSKQGDTVLVVSNFTPVPREDYVIPVSVAGTYDVLLNSDDTTYWGSGLPIPTQVISQYHEGQQAHQVRLSLPPLSTLFYTNRSQ
ncbi:1,4-alpha-glucan branching protein GlgB (plasmid) [Photobacterium sp. GJ3]|uniref:1,4-alpha-glucan branching protein GlgB n=1 Tax=Photobacterium sp. GJ3 TaxID=2829502 RepID=UPI001B8C1617|nr:1,4-alpha-glucan branching protein GlgB [Photobacterium sp. GJ3]QUJ70587.1 1,4-alpha-glucan branching protein GlgB [Photobacterium sp. GJ3]